MAIGAIGSFNTAYRIQPTVRSAPGPIEVPVVPTEEEDAVRVTLSDASIAAARSNSNINGLAYPRSSDRVPPADAVERRPPEIPFKESDSEETKGSTDDAKVSGAGAAQDLSSSEEAEVQELAARDREVRAHEQAHLSSLGGHRSGGATYTFRTGPDGKRYAVGGEVPVDVSAESTPTETIAKAQTIRQAALAPADPSGADRQVAAKATQLEAEARAEQAQSANDDEGDDGKNGKKAEPTKINVKA